MLCPAKGSALRHIMTCEHRDVEICEVVLVSVACICDLILESPNIEYVQRRGRHGINVQVRSEHVEDPKLK